MEQLDGLLSGADVTLSGNVLDRIDAIVPLGVDLNTADAYAVPHPATVRKELRRRAA